MKFAAAVILYNPSENEIKNINSYLYLVEEVFIFDNSENNNNSKLLHHLNFKNYTYIKNNGNEGLCVPLNKAIDFCISKNYDFLLTMDQDSYFLKENLYTYIESIKNFNGLNSVGQFGLWFKKYELKNEGLDFFESRPYLITSSSIININQINKHKIRFDENLFIDSVDFDFSFNILLHGLKNILFTDNYFVHKLGEPVKKASIKSLYLIKKKKNVHSSIRMYYIKRNSLYLENKYLNTKLEKHARNIRIAMKNYLKTCLYYSKNPFKAFAYIKKAEKDYLNKKMGKINDIT